MTYGPESCCSVFAVFSDLAPVLGHVVDNGRLGCGGTAPGGPGGAGGSPRFESRASDRGRTGAGATPCRATSGVRATPHQPQRVALRAPTLARRTLQVGQCAVSGLEPDQYRDGRHTDRSADGRVDALPERTPQPSSTAASRTSIDFSGRSTSKPP